MSFVDLFIENNDRYASEFSGPLPMPPARQVAIVACMDARLDVYRLLGLSEGDAHVIRNAGGIIDEGAIRSLIISQRLLGTKTIVLIHHTDCGMLTFNDDELRETVREDAGFAPSFAFGSFDNAEDDVRAAVLRIQSDPFLLHADDVHGFVFDVATGQLKRVDLDVEEETGSLV